MTILLLNSTVRFRAVKMNQADQTRPVQAGPSYGLLSIAGTLRNAGHSVVNLDPNIYEGWDAFVGDLCRELSSAEVVGVSCCSPSLLNDERVIRAVRENRPSAIIVAGGYGVTLRPALLLECAEADVVIAGEGEVALLRAVQVLAAQRSRHPLGKSEAEALLRIPGVGVRYSDGGRECTAPPADRYRLSEAELEALPQPAWDIAPLDAYRTLWGSKYINVSTSRSCDRNCPFCSIIDFHGHGLRLLPAGRVTELIADANARVPDLQYVFFCDAHFTAIPDRTLAICGGILDCKAAGEINSDIAFGCEARTDTITGPLLDAMRDTGFTEVWLGLESGSDAVLKEYRKGQHVAGARQTIQAVHTRGMAVIAFLMIASPRSTIADVLATLDLGTFVVEHGGDITPDVAFCQIAWEGTRLIEQTRKEDFDIGFVLGEFSKTDSATGATMRRYVAEGGYVFPCDPVTRRLVLGAYFHAVAAGSVHTSTLLTGFFLSLRDVFERFPVLRREHGQRAREIFSRARRAAAQRKVNNWGIPFTDLARLDESLL
jgi:anaerobic magnesium-protoporphyrin IX monomethyl ester cyclase